MKFDVAPPSGHGWFAGFDTIFNFFWKVEGGFFRGDGKGDSKETLKREIENTANDN